MFKEFAELIRSFLAPSSSGSSSSNINNPKEPPAPPPSGKGPAAGSPRTEGKSGADGRLRPSGRKPRSSPADTAGPGSGQKGNPSSGQGFFRAADQFASAISRDRFLRQQAQAANLEGSPCAYVPFNVQLPVYSSLHPSQRSYYFYWRSRFRKGLYEKTDSGYIRLLCFEIMSGTGWTDPAEGLAVLGTLLSRYGDQFPILRASLCLWYRDFAVLHRLRLPEFPAGADPADASSGLLNIYLCSQDPHSPLKLPYEVLEALIDYPLARSRFRQAGNDRLMREALPRCAALADQILRKETGKGILETYMPADVSVLMLRLYAGAVAADTGRTIKITVRNYQAAAPLREYLTNLVRHCENCLRVIMKYRGRLRDIRLDDKTAGLIDAFLKREYDPAARKQQDRAEAAEKGAPASSNMRLDFEKIRSLRIQSDHVRDLLEVNEEDIPDEIRRETVLTGQAEAENGPDPYRIISAREFYEILAEDGGFEDSIPAGSSPTDSNPADSNPAESSPTESNSTDSSPVDNSPAGSGPAEEADPDVAALYAALTGLQRETLTVLLQGSDTAERLRSLASESMRLPEQLVDELNEKSMEFLGDILVESAGDSYEITEEYLPSLRLCQTHSPALNT